MYEAGYSAFDKFHKHRNSIWAFVTQRRVVRGEVEWVQHVDILCSHCFTPPASQYCYHFLICWEGLERRPEEAYTMQQCPDSVHSDGYVSALRGLACLASIAPVRQQLPV